jgi:3-deoxy-manno-octulosonate cytidylyltransferase (CMP-KDO synthetase)
MAFKVVIPARYNSTRLPGKPLIEIAGLPMVIHVARKAKLSGAEEIIIATDDARILTEVENFGFEALMTDPDHASGTDRILEVAKKKSWPSDTKVINVQGDEPLIDPKLIVDLNDFMNQSKSNYVTAAAKFKNYNDFINLNNVKVILDQNRNAVYFSRTQIPYSKLHEDKKFDDDIVYHHIGIYGYSVSMLEKFCNLKKSKLEESERLEQLRAIYNQLPIQVLIHHGNHCKGVDTLEDLTEVKKMISN